MIFVAFQHRSFNRLNDQIFSAVHRQRERLQNKMIAIAIDNHSRQSVALAPDQATKSRIDSASRAIFRRLRDAALEKIEIEILFPARKTPRHDLRFAVVNRAPDQMVVPVFERNHIAIGRFAENFQHFAGKNPVVSMQNARARFDNDSGHKQRFWRCRLCQNSHAILFPMTTCNSKRLSIFPESRNCAAARCVKFSISEKHCYLS